MSPSPRSSTAVDARHALRMVAHRPSAVASRPAASRRIRKGYLRCISSYAIWLAAVITLANESHARVTRWKVEITMANFCFAGEWLCQDFGLRVLGRVRPDLVDLLLNCLPIRRSLVYCGLRTACGKLSAAVTFTQRVKPWKAAGKGGGSQKAPIPALAVPTGQGRTLRA